MKTDKSLNEFNEIINDLDSLGIRMERAEKIIKIDPKPEYEEIKKRLIKKVEIILKRLKRL